MSKRIQVLVHQIKHKEENNTRVDYGDIDQLKQRLKSFGVQGVIRVIEDDDGTYTLDDGFRRVTALKSLLEDGVKHSDTGDSLEVLEAEVVSKDLSDSDRSKLNLAINTSQKSWTPYEQAVEIETLLTTGSSMEEVGEVLGLKEMAIKQRLSLLKAPQALQEALRDNKIDFAHARAIQRIDDEELQEQLISDTISDDLTTRAVERRANELVDAAAAKLGKKPRKRKGAAGELDTIVLRGKADVLCQLDDWQSDIAEATDPLVEAEMRGYLNALQWVLVDKRQITEEKKAAAAAKKAEKEAAKKAREEAKATKKAEAAKKKKAAKAKPAKASKATNGKSADTGEQAAASPPSTETVETAPTA